MYGLRLLIVVSLITISALSAQAEQGMVCRNYQLVCYAPSGGSGEIGTACTGCGWWGWWSPN